ncbi:MAG: N-acetylmuramoyl-L-alanine amidase [Gammaproteobacteria bacterium]|nr:N-acetylmuramoyl-L-alanine amidase [Gammaproteobacteria bacterium]MCW8927638.1 N-acetylmuramoyl-L-alanine amidase [Gammaproteobacteria bacterium]MCW8959595.1 N-acetylmuramoyl-L-alanine amidase [Gammaproteobacteria bacterium]MCW8971837.1 N-acetylmuramoyl-L-alanine amidase [Gammaproteobacteria bacterium]MCW8994113.1 N-acetylmuramoyl-L-alanine amidase [Gammaproteobacteria bacterium]
MSIYRQLAPLLLLFFSVLAQAQSEINGVRMWPAPDNTRVVFDTSEQVEHSLFTLENPDRIVIDIKSAQLKADTDKLVDGQGVLKGIRSGKHAKHDLRVVLDLNEAVQPKSFILRPNEEYGHRLVIDLNHSDKSVQEKKTSRYSSAPQAKAREIVVAIDAGHGGEDPGAIGPGRTREKDVVLAIAQKLHSLLQREPGFRPVMIRDGDYYIGLSQRVALARKFKADLLVSIHADSFRDHRASGSSVYTLSPHGATSEQARLLAEKENDSDLIGGVSLEDKDDLLASVLLDLSQTATIEASTDVGARVLTGLKGLGKVHKRRVEQAGFRVLKAPDMPSILVETAFISNPAEERKLRSASHQHRLATAMLSGLRSYFIENPPPGTVLAQARRRHIIARGDTLSGIARHYQVSMDSLKSHNGLRSSQLRVGQILRIPSDS